MGQEILYCSRCRTRVVSGDFEKGEAFRIGEEVACNKCGMALLAKAPVAVQQQILEQKKRALDRKTAPARPPPAPRPPVPETPREPTLSRTGIAVLGGIGLALVVMVGMLAMSSSPPAPKPADAGPDPREIAAQGAIKVALSYIKDHPAEFDEHARLLKQVASEYPGTPAAVEAGREIDAVARRRKEAADAELASLLSKAREMGAGGEYQKALDLLEPARKKRPEIDARIKELTDTMAKEFPALRDRGVQARKKYDITEVELVRTQIAKWGSRRYAEELEKALSEVSPVITQRDNGNFMLRVSEGLIVGKRLKRLGDGEWTVTSEWTQPEDYIEWVVSCQKPGTYALRLNYAAPKEYKGVPYGGEATVTVGDQKKTFALESTKLWGDHTTFAYGTITLPAGEFKVTVRPAKIINGLMALRYVQFVVPK